MILSGKMTKRAEFFTRTPVKSPTGAVTYSDTSYFTCKCNLSNNVSNWTFSNGENAWEFVTLIFRHDERIAYGLKLTIDGVIYEIKTIKEISEMDGIQILARRVTPYGEI